MIQPLTTIIKKKKNVFLSFYVFAEHVSKHFHVVLQLSGNYWYLCQKKIKQAIKMKMCLPCNVMVELDQQIIDYIIDFV